MGTMQESQDTAQRHVDEAETGQQQEAHETDQGEQQAQDAQNGPEHKVTLRSH